MKTRLTNARGGQDGPRAATLALCLVLIAAAPAAAQVAGKQSCGGKEPVGTIGISGVDCDCTISSPGSGRPWSFRSEPKVTSLEADSPAGRLLEIGDIITHVNGKPIRNSEGAQALAALRPGEPVVLTVRRNGVQQSFAMTPDAACPTTESLLGIYAPSRPKGAAPSARTTPRTPSPRVTPAPRPGTAPKARPTYATVPRGSFGMGLSCTGNCSIRVTEEKNVPTMLFSQPPEVYSIERDGPADRAGMRRGDVITHIDGKPVNSAAGGRLFANAQAGDTVRFTIRRGGERKTILVQVAPRVAPAPQLARSSESLERARASLSELQREQSRQLEKIQEELRRSQRSEEQKVRELQRAMVDQERGHRAKLSELAAELERTERRLRAAMSDSARSCPAPMIGLGASRAGRTLRYTGMLGDTEIEVRGPDRVSVTESGDEIEIAAAGTVVKLKAGRKK